jgi:hypothetical protein
MMSRFLKYPWPDIQTFISAFYPYLKFFPSLKKLYIASFMSTLFIVVIDINCSFERNYGYLTFLVQAVTGLLLGVGRSECQVFIDFKNRLSSALKLASCTTESLVLAADIVYQNRTWLMQ